MQTKRFLPLIAVLALLCAGCQKMRDSLGTTQLIKNDKEVASRIGGVEGAVVNLQRDVNKIKSSQGKLDSKITKVDQKYQQAIDLTDPTSTLSQLVSKLQSAPPRTNVGTNPGTGTAPVTGGQLVISSIVNGVHVYHNGQPGTQAEAERIIKEQQALDQKNRQDDLMRDLIKTQQQLLNNQQMSAAALTNRVSAVETRAVAGEARTEALERDLKAHAAQFDQGIATLKTTMADRDAAFEKSLKDFAAARKIVVEPAAPGYVPTQNAQWCSEGRYIDYCPERRGWLFGRRR